jgi:hypothetical protein
MKRLLQSTLTAALAVACVTVVHAKLDPPTPDELAAAARKRDVEVEQLKREQQALTRVQDEIAARYRREHPGAGAPQPTGQTPREELPRTARELPRDGGPHGRDEPGAEAHSAPAGNPRSSSR